jgi:preprotein translocase subunit SecG
MDSLGRRVYQVDNRTFERELKTYFDNNFHERVSSESFQDKRPTQSSTMSSSEGVMERGIKFMSRTMTVIRFIFMIIMLYLLFSMGKKLYEDMEQAMKDENTESEGDAFDKMFGSEFKGKFKNARQNKGVFQARQEEMRIKNLKEDKNTTSPIEVRKLIQELHDIRIVGLLKQVVQCSSEDFLSCIYLKDFAKRGDSQNLFRILYRGYTYRELLSPKVNKLPLLREASSYVLQCIAVQD